MAGQHRKCANCRFFSDAGMPGNGWCTHPKRQLNTGVKLLVRGGELACRNSWGGDLFQSRASDGAEPVVAADLPAADGDDQITSVSIPSIAQPEPEDRVITDRPAARRQPIDANDAAHRDQEERARLMARGSRDAIAHARQRFSTRQQPNPGGDVVADDDAVLDSGGDRVVTRQARFSDRDFGANLPPMKTGPVPREEIEQRGGGSEDRFNVVPEIDPDFDMPAQRQRLQADAQPDPEPDEAPASDTAVDELQITAYEHVLQRARRIRASKQERQRPIRHADLIPGWDEPARRASDDRAHKEVRLAEPEDYDGYLDDDGELDAFELTSSNDAQVDDEPTGESDDIVAEAWTDEDQAPDTDAWEAELREWDQDEDDAPYEPVPRRRGWLNRFGLGHRSSEPVYDDATITRHADTHQSWLDDEPLEEIGAGWTEPEAASVAPWPSDHDDLPARRASPQPRTVDDDFLIPAPVPTSERSGSSWNVESMPVHAAPPPPSRPRQRLTAELPDLDDALFDAPVDRVVRSSRPHWTQDTRDGAQARDAGDALRSSSPRDSFFRASRFAHDEAAPPFVGGAGPDGYDGRPIEESTLPDIESGRLDVRDVVARGAELIDRRIEVAPEIPRQCRTCRSFRSADGGTRGWCTNEWAFTHRRMVNDDDLACVGSIGCWWLPADHLRLDLDDDLEDVRTPRMDELIAGARPAARRVVGE